MKPCGVIITYIDWSKWKTWWFNIPLFLFQLVFMVVGKIISKVDTPLRRVWRAAQASHVRLVLYRKSWFLCLDGDSKTNFEGSFVANFGYPKMEIQLWHERWNDGKRFEYREPTFTLPQEAIDEMIDYAEGEVGKSYDKLQLLSPVINFVIWIFWWPLWGQEKIRWANQPGGAEFCTSGLTACLRWAIKAIYTMWFFLGYSTAMVMPCLIVISEKWRKR